MDKNIKLTPAQAKLLGFLMSIPHHKGASALDCARYMWPDNKLWSRRVGRQVSLPGSAILIMKAGSILNRLHAKGCVVLIEERRRWISCAPEYVKDQINE